MAARKTSNSKKTSTNSSSKTMAEIKSTSAKSDNKILPVTLKSLIPAIIVLVIILLLGLFRNQFIVATVNNQPVTRWQLMSALEKKDGKAVLDTLVTEQLIMQEAAKRKVSVTNTEVNSELSKIETSLKSQGQTLDSALSQQGMTRADLTNQVKLQLLLEKMVGSVSVTDKEVADFITQNKDSIPAGTDEATINAQAKQQLQQQKLNTKIQTFVSNLQSKAKINYLLKL